MVRFDNTIITTIGILASVMNILLENAKKNNYKAVAHPDFKVLLPRVSHVVKNICAIRWYSNLEASVLLHFIVTHCVVFWQTRHVTDNSDHSTYYSHD